MSSVKIYGILFLLMAGFRLSQAQDTEGWQVLGKIFEAYSGRIAFRSDMRLYHQKDTSRLLEEINARYKINGRFGDYVLGYVEIIKTPKYYVQVNNHFKTILVAHAGDSAGMKNPFDLNVLKKLIDSTDTEITVGETKKQNYISLDFADNGQVKSYRINYTPSTWLVNRILIHFINPSDSSNDKILDIRYYDYRTREKVTKITENKIVTINDKGIIPDNKYREYKIISQL